MNKPRTERTAAAKRSKPTAAAATATAPTGPVAPEDAEPEARLAVNLPASVHRALKARAAEQGKSIRDYILGLLARDGLRIDGRKRE